MPMDFTPRRGKSSMISDEKSASKFTEDPFAVMSCLSRTGKSRFREQIGGCQGLEEEGMRNSAHGRGVFSLE